MTKNAVPEEEEKEEEMLLSAVRKNWQPPSQILRALWGHQACEVLCVLSALPVVLPTGPPELPLTGGDPPGGSMARP